MNTRSNEPKDTIYIYVISLMKLKVKNLIFPFKMFNKPNGNPTTSNNVDSTNKLMDGIFYFIRFVVS